MAHVLDLEEQLVQAREPVLDQACFWVVEVVHLLLDVLRTHSYFIQELSDFESFLF